MNRIEIYWTTNPDLASALLALGFRLRNKQPVTRVLKGDKATDTFHFETKAMGDFGELDAGFVVKAWSDKDVSEVKAFAEKHPEAYQVLDYIRSALHYRRELIKAIKENVTPLVCQNVDGWDMFLPAAPSEKLKAKMQRILEDVI